MIVTSLTMTFTRSKTELPNLISKVTQLPLAHIMNKILT